MAGQVVVNGAMLQCTFGAAPSALTVLPTPRVMASSQPAATIMDSQPMANISSFGVCVTPSNPQVAAATAAALGVLTPQPCIPATGTPWTPGSPTVLIGGQPALTNVSTCMCMWGGVISVTANPNMTVQA
jgi:uncharacterized Zn-binding protein involved in type VI secretion